MDNLVKDFIEPGINQQVIPFQNTHLENHVSCNIIKLIMILIIVSNIYI